MSRIAKAASVALFVLALQGCSSGDQASGAPLSEISGVATPTAQQFVNAAAKLDALSVETSRLALVNVLQADIESYAYDLLAADQASQAGLSQAAQDAGVTPDARLERRQLEELRRLGKPFHGQFDGDFIETQLRLQREALSVSRAYADHGSDPTLKRFAAQSAARHAAQLARAEPLMAIVRNPETKSHYEPPRRRG